jgi:zinc protease
MNFPATSATRHVLPCGLNVILDPNESAPVVAAQIWIETGSRDEDRFAGAGISHLLEHMVFKGTKSFNCATLAQSVQEKGGHWNAYTSYDRTVYYIDGPADSTNFFLQALTELVFGPTLPVEDFETEKDVIRREIDMGLDDPDSVASELLFRTFYQYDHRRFPIIGDLARFNDVTHEDMVNYHDARYRPSNCFLVLSGQFDSEAILKTLKNLTSEIPNRPTLPVIDVNEPRPVGRRLAREQFATSVSSPTLAWPIPACTEPDCPAVELLAQALGGGSSSPLYQRFREKSGLAHHISVWAWTPRNGPGLFAISAELPEENRDQFESELLTELPALIAGLTEADLAKAYRQMAAAQFRTLTTAAGRASDLGSNWQQTRNLDFTRDYLADLEKVSLAEVKAVAAKYLVASQLTITSLDPEKTVEREFQVVTKPEAEPLREHLLSNGLRVLLKRDSRVPAIHMQSPFLAGLPSETAERAGLGTLHAATFKKGTAEKSALEFSSALESLGARLRLGNGNNTALLSGFCLSPDLQSYLALVAESLQAPAFPEEAIAREKASQLAAILEAGEDPARMAFYHLRRHLFGERHYGLPRLGMEETVTALTRENLLDHHKHFFTGRNGVIALFGDLPDDENVLEWLEEGLGSLDSGELRNFTPEVTNIPTEKGEHRHQLDREQAVLAIAVPGLSFDSPDAPAAELLQEHTSNMAGPLFTRIREELGLAYYVSSNQFHGIGTGMFASFLGTSPEQLDLAHRELEATLESLAEDGLTQPELDRARTATLSSHALDEQSLASQARQNALDTILGLGAGHSEKVLEQMKNLPLQELNRFTKELLTRDSVTTIVAPE